MVKFRCTWIDHSYECYSTKTRLLRVFFARKKDKRVSTLRGNIESVGAKFNEMVRNWTENKYLINDSQLNLLTEFHLIFIQVILVVSKISHSSGFHVRLVWILRQSILLSRPSIRYAKKRLRIKIRNTQRDTTIFPQIPTTILICSNSKGSTWFMKT